MALQKFYQRQVTEAGCDESGRGCLAGPVFAAAVILNPKKSIAGLDDSKKLSNTKRADLKLRIEENALAYAVAMFTNQQIDEVNILKASFLAMHKALDNLSQKPGLILVDGNRFIPYPNTPHQCIIKGDAKFQSIAAASILAKTYRDAFMLAAHQQYPQYKWDQNMGYPTAAHRLAIAQFGPTPLHRLSFTLLPPQLKLPL